MAMPIANKANELRAEFAIREYIQELVREYHPGTNSQWASL